VVIERLVPRRLLQALGALSDGQREGQVSGPFGPCTRHALACAPLVHATTTSTRLKMQVIMPQPRPSRIELLLALTERSHLGVVTRPLKQLGVVKLLPDFFSTAFDGTSL
jgi:hypothetical protein